MTALASPPADALGDLTPEQRRAVVHEGSHLLIVAGAGTGKTSTLAARLGHLLASGAAPAEILLLTFTRRAAATMLDRAALRAGAATVKGCWAGTFHAIAHRLLRRHGPAIGIDPSFSVIDAADSADLLALVRTERAAALAGPTVTLEPAGPEVRLAAKHTLAAVYSRCVNTGLPLGRVLTDDFPWVAEQRDELAGVFTAYLERKRDQRVLDYDDLLLGWAALADAGVGQRFAHVLVDEYQDTNLLQADLLEALARSGATITAVGDDAQSIYAFRGASHANMLGFPERFGAEVVVLDRNHRSTPAILAATNAVIAEAADRFDVALWSSRPDGPLPEMVNCGDEAAQSAAVCLRVLEHRERGVPLRQQAVLYRSSRHAQHLEVELTARKIPFVKFGGLRFLESAHVKDLLCLLRVATNPHDGLAWFRVLQLIDGVGAGRAQAVVADLATVGPVAALASLPATAYEVAGALVDAVEQSQTSALSTQPGAQVDRLRQWLDPLLVRRHRDAGPRLADLDRLTEIAGTAESLPAFLADLTLDPPASTGDLAGPPSLDDDWLVLSTIHSAKGGEWDAVHVIHLTDGSLPSDLSTGKAEAIEEERRLLYVAMTRARDHLHAYVPLRYHHHPDRLDDDHSYGQASRFLTPAVRAHLRAVEHPPRDAVVADGVGLPVSTTAPGLAALHRRVDALFR